LDLLSRYWQGHLSPDEILAEFSYRIEHCAGKKHGNADGMICRLVEDCKQYLHIEKQDGRPACFDVKAQERALSIGGSTVIFGPKPTRMMFKHFMPTPHRTRMSRSCADSRKRYPVW